MREIIATGKTVEEATENGCKEIGLEREQVSVEILSMPIKKFFKTIPAKVKITEIEEIKNTQPVVEKKEPAKVETKQQQVKAKVSTEKAPANKNRRVLPSEPEVEIEVSENEQAAKAVEYIRSIFMPLGIEIQEIKVYKQGDATLFRMNEVDLSSVINVNGDIIQALSYLLDRAANKGVDKTSPEYMHVRIDISGYRDKREVELVELANKVGAEVNRTHKSKTLQPMNSYERLIVHTAISEMDGLISESVGRDNYRRVVIKSTADDATNGGDWKPNYKDRRPSNNNRSSNNRNKNYSGGNKNYNKKSNYSNTPKREYTNNSSDKNEPIVPKTRQALNDGDDLPLYGKIEL